MRQIQGLPSPSYRKSIKFFRLFFNVRCKRDLRRKNQTFWFLKYLVVGKKEENKNVHHSQLSSDGGTINVLGTKIITKQYLFVAYQICQESVKITITGGVSISAATVIFKLEIKATAVFLFLHLLIVVGVLSLVIVYFYLTITWGAAARTASVAMMVNKVNVIKQSLSRTIAANFQSLSIAVDSSSSRILSVITLISFRMRLSSLGTPEG